MTCDILPDTTTLTVLSLNCWGIRWVSKDYKARMRAIRKTLFQDRKYDVICFQEIWDVGDFERFQMEAEHRGVFPYSHYFYSGVFGSGVCVFSQWPIEEMLFYKWQLNGYIHKITHADWYGGKGIGLCTLNVKGKKVNIYTCHTHAEYSTETEYLAHRVVQAFDIAQFIRLTSQNADLTVLAADLNSEPDDLCFKIIVEYANLNDSFEREGVVHEGTYGCPRNTYSRCMSSKKPEGERIDHILYKSGTRTKVECSGYQNPLESTVPNSSHSYSDHEAIAASFTIYSKAPSPNNDEGIFCENTNGKNYQNSLEDAYRICNEFAGKLSRDIKWCFRIGFFTALMFVVSAIVMSCFFIQERLRFNFLIMSVVSFIITVLSLCVLVWKRIEFHGILCAAHGMKLPLKIKVNRAVGKKM